MKTLILTILSVTLLLAVPYASAQEGIDNRIPTNLTGVFTYASPPSGFVSADRVGRSTSGIRVPSSPRQKCSGALRRVGKGHEGVAASCNSSLLKSPTDTTGRILR